MENTKQVNAQNQIYDESLSTREVEARLDRLINSPGGLQVIGQQMLSPLKRDLLFEGRIRQLFQTYKLALGEQAVFDADVEVPAAALGVEGQPYQAQVVSDRVRIDTAPITTKPIVRWNESNFRKFDILNRAQERAKASLQYQEDIKGYNLIKYASTLTGQGEAGPAGTLNPTVIADTSGKLSMEKLVEGIVTLRSKLLVASKVWMNPFRGKDLMLFNVVQGANGGAGIFAPNYQEQLLKAGRTGNIWGCEVVEDIVVPNDEVYVLAPADYIGVLAVRTDVSVETMKDVNQFADIFAVWEDIGFVVRYAKGITRIDISS